MEILPSLNICIKVPSSNLTNEFNVVSLFGVVMLLALCFILLVGDPVNIMTSPFSTAFSYLSCIHSSFVLEPTNVGEGDRGGDNGADAGADAVVVAVDTGAGDASSGLDWTMVSLCLFRFANRTA
jgi:hypothetical protein